MLNLSSETKYVLRTVGILSILLGLCLSASCNVPEFEVTNSPGAVPTPTVLVSNMPEVKDALAQKAARLTELYDKKDCKEFFMTFPATFKEFDQLYGFDDKKGGRILYSKYPEHFPYFFGCPEVSDRQKLDRVIRIGIGGKYNDGTPIDIFHDSTFELIKKYPDEAKKILDRLPDKKAASFWYFLFDKPDPADEENLKKVEVLRNILGRSSKQSRLLEEQYQKLLHDWGQH